MRSSNYQDLVKVVGIIAMLLDHIGSFFFPEEKILRAVGRIALPIFSFYAGYNFKTARLELLVLGSILTLCSLISGVNVQLDILVCFFVGQFVLFYAPETYLRALLISAWLVTMSLPLSQFTCFLFVLRYMICGRLKRLGQYDWRFLAYVAFGHFMAIYRTQYFSHSCLLLVFGLFTSFVFFVSSKLQNKYLHTNYGILAGKSLYIYFTHLSVFHVLRVLAAALSIP